MENGGCFLHRTDNIPADDLIPGGGRCGKVPFFLPIQRRHLYPAGKIVALHFFHNGVQRALDTVVDIFHQAGAKLHRKG